MIAQNVCLGEIMPMVLEMLRSNEWGKVEQFPVDLLSAVVRANKSYQNGHKEERLEVKTMLTKRERIEIFIQILD